MNNDGFAQRHVDEFVRVASVFQRHVHAKRTGDFHVFTDEDAIITVHRCHVSHGLLDGPCIGPSALFRISPSAFTHGQWSINTTGRLLSRIPFEVVGVRIGIVEGRDAFRDRLWFRPGHLDEFVFRSFNGFAFFRFHRFENGLIDTHVNQQRSVRWNRVFCFPIRQQISVNISCRRSAWVAQIEVVVMMSVAATSHGFNMDERWPTARH